MKSCFWIFSAAIWIQQVAIAQEPSWAIYTNDFTFGSGGRTVRFNQEVAQHQIQNGTSYRLADFFGVRSAQDVILRASPASISFDSGEIISTNSPVYPDPAPLPGGFQRIRPLSVDWVITQPGNFIKQSVNSDLFPGQNGAIIGFRLGSGPDSQVGWARIHRSSATIITGQLTSLDQTAAPYELVETQLNPFVGKSIRAGFPPELPALRSEYQVSDSGDPSLHLWWESGYSGVRLQYAITLDGKVEWIDTNESGNDLILIPPAEGNVFYRLSYVF